MDRIANQGLRYNRVFSTALCSPTRAALITGRNHHSAGFGVISEQSTGFPGYNIVIEKDKATIGRILLDNGYATSWFGKTHNTPPFAASQVGPFDQWPIGMGFEYFYGFVGGDANQWQPNLFRNTTQIYPFQGKEGTWNLITGMADDAIDYLNRLNQTQPDKKFFIKYAPGATHAPHHPTREWVQKIHDMHLFDDGYEKLRERIFENQKKLGVVPADAKLTPWPAHNDRTIHTNTVEGFFSIFKRGMKGVYQHCGHNHLNRYLAEFDFRYSNRVANGINDTDRAEKLLQGVKGKRLTYETTH
jgi:arylsulfatase